MQVNAELLDNPLLRQDPYGKGWLLSIHVPDEENTTRNLVPKMLVGDWMREAVERLYARQPALAGERWQRMADVRRKTFLPRSRITIGNRLPGNFS